MALDHAILVSLAEQPSSGYELSRRFSQSIGHFWTTTHQQIYRTLKRLHEQGLIASEEIAQTGRPDKKNYSITPAGRDVLRDWVATPTPMPQLRSDFAVKLRGATHTSDADILRNVEHHRQLHQQQLALYLKYMTIQFPQPSGLTGRDLHQYLVLRGGIRTEEAQIAWCDEILDELGHTSKECNPKECNND